MFKGFLIKMKIEKAKLVISHFLKIDVDEINNATVINHTAIKSSLLLHRMYAKLASEGFILEDPASIETFGDFIMALSDEKDNLLNDSSGIGNIDKKIKSNGRKLINPILSVGVDIESVSSLEYSDEYSSNIFYTENFTNDEIQYCVSKPNPQQSFTALFATKEAIIKADNSYKKVKFNAINIKHNEIDKPSFKDFSISISHSEEYVVAVAIKLDSHNLPNLIENEIYKLLNKNKIRLNKVLVFITTISIGFLSIFLLMKFL
tara:strand:- start:121 stop:906 length:786 start_codon:yes stop_codon:yes gene_type:complete